jgi:Chaperone of endosialidase
MKTITSTISNSINDSLLRCAFIIMPFLLMCVATLPGARAVSSAPDGGYPNGNTAEGQNALLRLTTGTFNTAIGLNSLERLTGGKFNTGVGAKTFLSNRADQNTAIGFSALFRNTTGVGNTANGASALFSNMVGSANTAIGTQALFSSTGDANMAVGRNALFSNTVGSANTAVGFDTLFSNTTGNSNNAFGPAALTSNTTGGNNEAMGDGALHQNTTGNNNIAVGDGALFNTATGSNNIALGVEAGVNITDANHVICIGTAGANLSGTCFIGNIFGTTSGLGTSVFINSDGQLGTMTSSGRFKEKIKPMEQASDALFALKPVTFRYKREIDSQQIPQFGLVAEDVEKVNPDLVVRDKDGKPYSVRYEAVNAMLLNEFLKEHSTVQELKKEIAALTATVKEQSAQIQKVSAQLEASKLAPQMVSNR